MAVLTECTLSKPCDFESQERKKKRKKARKQPS